MFSSLLLTSSRQFDFRNSYYMHRNTVEPCYDNEDHGTIKLPCYIRFLILLYLYNKVPLYCPTLTKGSKSQITQIWDTDILRLDLARSTSRPSLGQKHSSCWKSFKSRDQDCCIDVHVNDRHVLLIYKKYHFHELLPFVKAGQCTCLVF